MLPWARGFPFLPDLGLVFGDHAAVTAIFFRISLLAPMAATHHRLPL
jgi:hypothetical protein